MKTLVYLLKKRRILLHVCLLFVYLLITLALNWDVGDTSLLRIAIVVLVGGIGVGIAYQTRYVLILLFRLRRRFLRAFLLFFGSFVVLGGLGYILFHGVDNRVADEVVQSTQAHPWKAYMRHYLRWYFDFAKYGAIFFGIEKMLFQSWDHLLSYWGVNWALATTDVSAWDDSDVLEARDQQFVRVPAEVVPLVHQVSLLLGFRPRQSDTEQLSSIPSLPPPLPEKTEAEPEHVTISWILDFLNVSRSTFYRTIRDQILFEVCRIGNRPYYLKEEVIKLMIRHEKGCWTFSKYLKQRKE